MSLGYRIERSTTKCSINAIIEILSKSIQQGEVCKKNIGRI